MHAAIGLGVACVDMTSLVFTDFFSEHLLICHLSAVSQTALLSCYLMWWR